MFVVGPSGLSVWVGECPIVDCDGRDAAAATASVFSMNWFPRLTSNYTVHSLLTLALQQQKAE